MTTTYSTDPQVDATDVLARAALSAFSDAAVARGAAAVADFDALRVEAQRQLHIDLATRGITEAEITDAAPLVVVEVALTLANLFEAVGQWNGQNPDVYARKGEWYRTRYERAAATVNPRTNELPTGGSFEWGRG